MANLIKNSLSKVKDILPISVVGAKPPPSSRTQSATSTSSVGSASGIYIPTVDELLARPRLHTKPLFHNSSTKAPVLNKIKIYPPPCPAPPKNPLALFTKSRLNKLDSSGLRTSLFSRHNKDALRPGDIVQVRFRDRNAEPFSGVILDIRRRGLDSAFLLRNHLTRIGVEMWYKVYSPKIKRVELVKRKEKRAKRAKLYYMRKPKHDMGSVESIVNRWRQSKMLFGGRAIGGKGTGKPKSRNKR